MRKIFPEHPFTPLHVIGRCNKTDLHILILKHFVQFLCMLPCIPRVWINLYAGYGNPEPLSRDFHNLCLTESSCTFPGTNKICSLHPSENLNRVKQTGSCKRRRHCLC